MPPCLRFVVIGALALLAPVAFATSYSPDTYDLAHKKRLEAAVEPNVTELNPTVETQGDGVDTSVTPPTSTYVVDDITGDEPIDPLTKEDSKLLFEFFDYIERENDVDSIGEFGFYDPDEDGEELVDLDDSAPTRFKRVKKSVVKWTLEERAEIVRGQHEAMTAQIKVIQAQVNSVLSADGLLGVTVRIRKLYKLILRSIITCLIHSNNQIQTDGDSTRLSLIFYELQQNYASLITSLSNSNAHALNSKPFGSSIVMTNLALKLYTIGTRLGLSASEQNPDGRYTYGSIMRDLLRKTLGPSNRTLGKTSRFVCDRSDISSSDTTDGNGRYWNWSKCFRNAQEAERRAYAAAEAAQVKASTPN